jgi:hypothetical protein
MKAATAGSSFKRAAATEESTPPLIATNTRFFIDLPGFIFLLLFYILTKKAQHFVPGLFFAPYRL